MEIALGAITLATAVKDLVELGRKIHESFVKVSNNLCKARRVAKDIKEMVEKLEVFYKNHEQTLKNMDDFRVALLGLLDKFRGFEMSILPLLPKMGKRGLGLFVRGWWNNNKIEEHISDLQSDVVQVMLEYMMGNAMRAEVKLETLDAKASNGLTAMAQSLEVLEIVRNDVSTLRTMATTTMTHYSYESSGTTSDELNRNIIMFAKSTPSASAPMLRTPHVITEELMTTAYIRLQFDSIAMIVEKMSIPPALPSTNIASNSDFSFQLVPSVEVASMNITHLRHHVVRQVTHARDLLESERVHTISIGDGALALNSLIAGLRTLGMHHECILAGNWARTLSRMSMLADVSGEQPNRAARLALYLLNQAMDYDTIGNTIQSLQATKEAYTITQNLRKHNGTEVLFQILYAEVLLHYAKFVDNKQSVQMSVESIQVLEDILNVQAFTQSTLHEKIERVVRPSSSFLDHLFIPEPLIPAIQNYALALERLGNYLCIDGHHESAVDLAHLAIALHRKMVSTHGHKYKVDLAFALSSLVQGRTAELVPAEELVVMAEECAQLLRELAEKNPPYYARGLVNVLWKKASTLERLKRDTEAITTWEEIAGLARQIIQDSALCARALDSLGDQFRRLKRHDDAARTGKLAITTYYENAEAQAWRYYYLCRDLRELHQYKKAIEAAQTCVTLFRHLATRDPKTWMGNVAIGLSDLAHSLAALGDFSEALVVWKESVSIIHNCLDFAHTDASSKAFDNCLPAIYNHLLISYIFVSGEQCLEINSIAVKYSRCLLELRPENALIAYFLLQAEFRYIYSLFRFGCLQDALQYIDQWLSLWIGTPVPTIAKSELERWHAVIITLKAHVLEDQGSTKQALLSTQSVREVVRPSSSTYQPSFQEMIESMIQEAQLLVSLGDGAGALQIAEEALRLSRDNKLEPIDESLVWSLYGVSFTASSCQNYKRAAEVAQEGCNMYTRSEHMEHWKINQYWEQSKVIFPNLFAILSSAEANLGRCSTALQYAHHAVDASLEIGEMKAFISTTSAEWSYMQTRGNLAEILLATGDLAQARQICEDRGAYFSKRVETRIGEHRNLAPILRMLGILSCSEGRHEEGEAAAKELCRIMKMLGSVFPSLQEEVKMRLRHQAQVPILKVLDDMSEKLDCGHQAEVVSLYAI